MTLMCHFVVVDGTPFFWEDPALIPTFPMTITAAEATPATAPKATTHGIKANKKFTTKLVNPIVSGKTLKNYAPVKMF